MFIFYNVQGANIIFIKYNSAWTSEKNQTRKSINTKYLTRYSVVINIYIYVILHSLARLEHYISVRLLTSKAQAEFRRVGWVLQAPEHYKKCIAFGFWEDMQLFWVLIFWDLSNELTAQTKPSPQTSAYQLSTYFWGVQSVRAGRPPPWARKGPGHASWQAGSGGLPPGAGDQRSPPRPKAPRPGEPGVTSSSSWYKAPCRLQAESLSAFNL